MERDRAGLLERSPTLQLVVLCTGVFGLQSVIALLYNWDVARGLFALALPVTELPWTVVTSVYAHGGIGHLVGNMVMLLLLGLILERVTTTARFHAFFLATGVAAGLFQVLLGASLSVFPFAGEVPYLTAEATAVLGASGAIFALLGYVVTGTRAADNVLDSLGLSPRLQLLAFAGLAVVVTILTASENAALGGHFFGFFLGLLAGRLNLLTTSTGGQQPVRGKDVRR